MDSPRPEIDLERELSCSICTELLYQPLTLLDCLHTFCGACLKEWFSWQATAAENAPTPPAPGSAVFTCPSCRAPVRNTRHNATVATLLDMFLAANPDKSKSSEEKAEMNKKYKPGEKVLPRLKIPEKTSEQRRLDEQERLLIEEVRQVSLREAIAESSSRPSSSRRRGESSSRDDTARHSRDTSGDPSSGTRARDARERARRQAADEEARRRAEQAAPMLQPDGRSRDEDRRQRSGSRQRSAERSEARRRHMIEHQSSLRSLISSSDTGSMDVEREIEEFARQIQEEGLLDGLDLDNLDLNNNDELSRKITEAYRRRQRQRSRNETTRRSTSGNSGHSDSENRPRPHDSSRASSRTASTQRAHSRSESATNERSRPPLSSGSAHLEVQEPGTRHRRRTSSGGRSATVPLPFAEHEMRSAARSQTDLTLRTSNAEASAGRPSMSSEIRSSSIATMDTSTAHSAPEPPNARGLPFNARVTNASLRLIQPHSVAQSEQSSDESKRARPPADLTIGPVGAKFVKPGGQTKSGPVSPPLASPSHQRAAPQLYPEPSITCRWCRREHIEYELHYNCSICHNGDWNVCLQCHRHGKGCRHWFGFGSAAWPKWEKARKETNGDLAEPHVLNANRYLPPRTIPGSADGRQTLITQNPSERLQSGSFCSRCFAWTNECFWRCAICNEGDWGFCSDCVNQGRCCTHTLLPLANSPHRAPGSSTPPATSSPRSPSAPFATASTGRLQPLTLTTRCDVCQLPIPPAQSRFYCSSCKPSQAPSDSRRLGDYNICRDCYAGLVADKTISVENGPGGWRRCPRGHRMAIVAFLEGGGSTGTGSGQWWRAVTHDCVGGRKLQFEQQHASSSSSSSSASSSPPPPPGLQTWYWFEGGHRVERLVSRDVRGTAGPADHTAGGPGPGSSDRFPPDGGCGMRAVAKWAWYPAAVGAEDELLFPRGAEIREIDDVNGEWFHGVYMGAKGLFPAPYVLILGREGV